MIGSMQDWPLLVWKLLDHAALNHGDREIVTQTVEGPLHRSTWLQVHARAKRLAQAMSRLGVERGDRVATMAWNTYRHIECWYAISGMGAVAHTLNPRLFQDQIAYIVNHAEDRVLFFDLDLLPIVEAIAPRLDTVRHFVVMTDREHMPDSRLQLLCSAGAVVDVDKCENLVVLCKGYGGGFPIKRWQAALHPAPRSLECQALIAVAGNLVAYKKADQSMLVDIPLQKVLFNGLGCKHTKLVDLISG